MNLRVFIQCFALVFVATITILPAHADESGLIGHWSFDQSLEDASPNELHGKMTAPTYVQGISGAAIMLSGRDQQIEIPHNDVLDLDTYTISMWIRSESAVPYATLLRKGNDERENYKLTIKYGNRLMGYMLGGDQRLLSLVPKEMNIEAGQWHYVVMTFDGNIWALFVDGKEVLTRSFSQTVHPAKNTEPILIGNENNIHGRGFIGAIDEVKIHNYAMTLEEIKDQYQKVLPDPSRANLVIHYPFEGDGKDVRRSGLDGIVRNLQFTSGVLGNAAEFNGKDAYLEIKSSSTIQMTRFSAETWLYLRNYAEGNYLYSKGTTGQEQMELRVGTDGELTGFLKFTNGDLAWFRTPRGSIRLGEWQHLVHTFEDNVFRIYVDGVMIYERVLQGKNLISTTTSPLFLGKKQSHSEAHLDGMLDEFKLYNRALTADEVATLYTLATTFETAPEKRVQVAHWSLDRTTDDSTSHGLHGKQGRVQYGEGILGDAAKFTDRRGAMRVSDSKELDVTEFSIGLWAKFENYNHGRYLYAKGEGSMVNYSLQTRMDGGLIGTIYFADGVTAQLRSRQGVMERNTWHYIVMTYTQGHWQLWVDGVVVADTKDYTAIPQINADDLFIGSNGALSSQYFPGYIDEVSIWNYVLSSEQINELSRPPLQDEIQEEELPTSL